MTVTSRSYNCMSKAAARTHFAAEGLPVSGGRCVHSRKFLELSSCSIIFGGMKFAARLARCFGCSDETPHHSNTLKRAPHSTNYDLEALKLHANKHNNYDINSKNLDIIWLVDIVWLKIVKFSRYTFNCHLGVVRRHPSGGCLYVGNDRSASDIDVLK